MSFYISNLHYGVKDRQLLNIAHGEFKRGELTVIKGSSGAGKTTLLYSLSGIDLVSGQMILDNAPVIIESGPQGDFFRRKHIGFIFQNIHLLPGLSCLDNVLLPFSFHQHTITSVQKQRAATLLEEFGIDNIHDSIDSLSRGEQQRIATARALIKDPTIILADEPTASLDDKSGLSVIQSLRAMAEQNKIVICTSHDTKLHDAADQLLTIDRGVFV